MKLKFWIVSIIFTILISLFQKITGPTYPVRGKIDLNGKSVKYKFLRSCTVDSKDCVLKFYGNVDAYVLYKHYKVEEDYKRIDFKTEGDLSVTYLNTDEPKAGKIEYYVYYKTGDKYELLNKKSVVLRFKGFVPVYYLVPHILFMFLFFVFSCYLFLENIFAVPSKNILYLNYVFLILGGFVLGPVVQYYAFDAWWSGVPFGWDLTDNKTLIMLVVWTVALIKYLKKDKNYRKYINISFIVTVITFLIPHSVMGSEFDYSKVNNVKN